jgi:hypothetical protein
MSDDIARKNLKLLLEGLDLPPGAYEKAEQRYQDLGAFFASGNARCAGYNPHISPQGSFRLGTVVRPLGVEDEYDLDVGCRLTTGVSKSTHSQERVKHLVGVDVQTYKTVRGIEKRLEEKRRCWRLSYKDELRFHMDIVPSIPEADERRIELREAIVASVGDRSLAASVAAHAGVVTDKETQNYAVVSPDWKVSNSEGFAIWFESRMLLARNLLENKAVLAKTTIAELPSRSWNSPLQHAIRMLKRHRDFMFRDNDDSKPISVIITTLAARAYQGENDLDSALEGILARMGDELRSTSPRVPNPVNPKEDFADKWAEPKHAAHRLEQNFRLWLQAARADFATVRRAGPRLLIEQAAAKFGAALSPDQVSRVLGLSATTASPSAPSVITTAPSKPWSRA